MTYRINHIHLKSDDPQQSAAWYGRAFGFTVANDFVRPAPFGDRFISCRSADGGMSINISGPLTGQALGPADWIPHRGLEHFGVDSDDIQADIERLRGLGAELLDGPMPAGGGMTIAFVKTPDGVRVELIQVAS
jgi:lactoylglutathione lyase